MRINIDECSQMITNDTIVRKLQMKVLALLMAVLGLLTVPAATSAGAYYLGAPDAAHAHRAASADIAVRCAISRPSRRT